MAFYYGIHNVAQFVRASALGISFLPAFFKPGLTAGIDPA